MTGLVVVVNVAKMTSLVLVVNEAKMTDLVAMVKVVKITGLVVVVTEVSDGFDCCSPWGKMRDFGGNGQRGKNDGLGGCGYCGESYASKGGLVAPVCVIKVLKMTGLVVVVNHPSGENNVFGGCGKNDESYGFGG